ncbi:MAG: hypothetical protein DRN66_01840 [Candidatus Nanohalarchaeota archaeon]|nr:MAG: hypothetical protein DRN66_01840 [Candidatus Nanohaloarchaeota archaeon]
MILKIINLLRDMIFYVIAGIANGLIKIINTFIQCAIVVKQEAAVSSPLELIIVFLFFAGLGWFLFKFTIGSIETYAKFIGILGVLAVLTLIIIIYF